MDVGRLRHVVTIRIPAIPADPIRGQAAIPAVALATNRSAAIEPLDGRELLAAQQVSASITHRVTLRYLAGVKPTAEVLYGTRTFQVVQVLNVEERNIELRLLCVELQN